MHPMTLAQRLNPQRIEKAADDLHREKRRHQSRSIDGVTARYFESLAQDTDWERKFENYLVHTREVIEQVIPKNKKVLLVGCLTSGLLEKVSPSYGVAIDIS